jgi:hypothetical protein
VLDPDASAGGITPEVLLARARIPTHPPLLRPAGLASWLIGEGLAVQDDSGGLHATARCRELVSAAFVEVGDGHTNRGRM